MTDDLATRLARAALDYMERQRLDHCSAVTLHRTWRQVSADGDGCELCVTCAADVDAREDCDA